MDIVKLMEAVAWPTATIFGFAVVLLVTRMIISKNAKFGINLKDWFTFEADASRKIATNVAATEAESQDALPENENPAGEMSAEISKPPRALVDLSTEVCMDQTDTALGELINAESLLDLNRAFEAYDAAADKDSDRDFWTTYYVDCKRELGEAGSLEELRGLADANTAWVNPLASLLRNAVATHDIEAAEVVIKQILARRNKDNSTVVLPAVVQAYYRLYSPERALTFFKDTIAAGATSTERANMLISLAANFSKSAQSFSYRTATEMALLKDSSRKAEIFNLAYNYADENQSWAIAFSRYCEIDAKDSRYDWSLNNRGVITQKIEKEISYDYYARAMKEGSALATSNLARLLVGDGYYAVAERLLDEIEDPKDDAEHVAMSRAEALAGRRSMNKRLDEIFEFATDEAHRYDAVVAKSMRSIEKNDPVLKGVFGSEDRAIMVMFDGGGAAARVTVGTIAFDGVIPNAGLGFAGQLTANGQGILGATMSFTILQTGPDEATAVIWPKSSNDKERLRITALERLAPVQSHGLEGLPPSPQLTS